ncbi:MAG: DUF4105 domain-containing protein [Campylobacterota bacterium]|nr:DUF4105 domain-containing protein [Campylobacterota bacterium]
MKSIIHLLFISSLLFFTLEANEPSCLKKALAKNLDKDDYWLKLLHFKDNKSVINNREFFLSPKGITDAKSELIETLKRFKTTPNLICKYPARYKWLNSKLKLDIKNQECKKLKEFLKPNFKKIIIVFTSERYDSPASVFGHTMMKIESDEIPYVINYAARIPDETNSFYYVYNGFSGGFKSRYRLVPFSIKDYEYRSGEFRDLIEFSLDLDKDEVENIMLHFYEIKDTNEDYYFLSHNCSSELIKLIDIAKYDSELSKDFNTIVIPIDIIYILQKHRYIDQITNQDSKLKQFYKIINKLSIDEKEILSEIVNNNYSVNRFANDKSLSEQSKHLIILSAIKYFEIKSMRGGLDKKSRYPFIKLIQLELTHNKSSDFEKIRSLVKNPISNRFHKFYVGINHNFNSSNEMIVGYRHLYRNRFDLVDDIKKNGSVELLDIAIRKKDNEVPLGYKFSLNHLTVVNLEAMPISNGFFKESINKIKLGASRVFLDDKLYAYFNYGLGYRYRLNKYLDYQFYTKAGAYYHKKDIYLASLESSVEYNYKNRFISEFIFESNHYTNGFNHNNISLNNHMKMSSSITMNLNLTHKNQEQNYNEIKLLLNYFF